MCGSSSIHTGLPESRHTPMTSRPTASTIIFISRACRSPPWFSTASFTPESRMRERRARTALTMLSMCISICGRSESPPRMQRMQVAPKICDALRARLTCSSTVPSLALNDRALGQTEPCASCSLMPSRSACSRICRIAGFVADDGRREGDHRPRELDRAEVVEELRRRELIAADAAIDRAELDGLAPATENRDALTAEAAVPSTNMRRSIGRPWQRLRSMSRSARKAYRRG